MIEFLGFVPFEIGETLRQQIRGWRKLNGVPRSELADRPGVDESTVSRWKVGETCPNGKHKQSIKKFLEALK